MEIIGSGDLHRERILFGTTTGTALKGDGNPATPEHVNVYVRDYVALGNGANLSLAPSVSVTFHVDGPLTMGDTARVNIDTTTGVQGTPSSVLIAVRRDATDSSKVSFGNGSQVAAVIYAPDSEVDLNQTTTFWGAIVADWVHGANGNDLHYDVDLNETCVPLGSRQVLLRSWSFGDP